MNEIRRGDLGVISFAKLVGAVAIPVSLAATIGAYYVESKVSQANAAQDAQARDVFVTRREYDERYRVVEEKLTEIREEQRRAREMQERIAAKVGVTR